MRSHTEMVHQAHAQQSKALRFSDGPPPPDCDPVPESVYKGLRDDLLADPEYMQQWIEEMASDPEIQRRLFVLLQNHRRIYLSALELDLVRAMEKAAMEEAEYQIDGERSFP